jgi:DNA-binding transcriptional LysR family regulator
LFERYRAGFIPLQLAQELARHAKQMQASRAASQASSGQINGSVRIPTTDTVLHGLVAPALQSLKPIQPLLTYDLHTGNELASLTRHDADIAVRATQAPAGSIGLLPMFLAQQRKGLCALTDEIEGSFATRTNLDAAKYCMLTQSLYLPYRSSTPQPTPS